MLTAPTDFRHEWVDFRCERDVTLDQPGIYEWRIEEFGSYIGRFTRSNRPRTEYERNLWKIILRLPYRPKNWTDFGGFIKNWNWPI